MNGRYLTEAAEISLVEYQVKIADKGKSTFLGNEETFFKVKLIRLVEKL